MSVSRRFHGDTPFKPDELITIAALIGVPVSAFFDPATQAA
jgi:hypothetical protein